MRIGVFDSGLGGLIITRTFLNEVGEYDYLYLGDTEHLPYGEKTPQEVTEYTIKAIEYLIAQNCKLIIMACNTASAIVIRYLQQIYMPKHHPDIKILGVVVPAIEEAIASSNKAIGVIATPSTVSSHMFKVEIELINPEIEVQEVAAPKLVKAVESNDFIAGEEGVKEYVKEFHDIGSLILGCTHYPYLKEYFRKYLPNVNIISQDEFMGDKLRSYLNNHPEIETVLDKNSKRDFQVTQLNEHYKKVAEQIMPGITIKEVKI